MTLHVNGFPDVAQAATALSQRIAADLRAALEHRPRALLLVSGGESPIPLFQRLAQAPLPWDRIDLSLVDERSVSPDDGDANAALIRKHLHRGPAGAARWIPLLPAALVDAADPWQAAQQAAILANANAALARADVLVLGLGNDGHTASLFPDAPQWPQAQRTGLRYLAVQPPSAPHERISLSLQALRTQGLCYLWAVGAEKRATLERLQALCDAAPVDSAGAKRVAAAGPIACLMADADVVLETYCADAG